VVAWRATTLLVSASSVATSDDHGGIGGGGEVTGGENITDLDQVVDTSPVQAGTHGNVSRCKSVGHVGAIIVTGDTGSSRSFGTTTETNRRGRRTGQRVQWGADHSTWKTRWERVCTVRQ